MPLRVSQLLHIEHTGARLHLAADVAHDCLLNTYRCFEAYIQLLDTLSLNGFLTHSLMLKYKAVGPWRWSRTSWS